MGDENQGAAGGERSEFRIPDSEFEQSLASLMPRAARIDRDRLMFLAGQAAVSLASGGREPPGNPVEPSGSARPHRSRAWPAAFAAMTALAASLLALLVNRPEPRVIERIVRVPIAAPAAVVAGPAEPGKLEFASEPPRSTPPHGAAPFGETYLQAREQVLAFGVDRWMQTNPSSAAAGGGAPTSYRELRDSLLQ